MIGLLLISSPAAAAGSTAERESRTFSPEGIHEITVETEFGSIEVVGVATGDVQVEFLDIAREQCQLTAEAKDRVLSVSAVRKAQSSRVNCPARVRILAPILANVDALSGTGNIDISSISGNVKTKTGTGKTSLRLLKGALTADAGKGSVFGTVSSQDVKLQVGTGSVDLKGLLGSASAQVGNGDLKLEWNNLPATAQVHVQTGHGKSSLVFPPEAKFSVRYNPPRRTAHNEFTDAEGADVFMQNADGEISILKSHK